jgi:hypothetical protein
MVQKISEGNLVSVHDHIRSRHSSVGIATDYELNGRDAIPGRGKIFLFFTAPIPTLGLTRPPIQRTLAALSPGGGGWWSYTSTPHMSSWLGT